MFLTRELVWFWEAQNDIDLLMESYEKSIGKVPETLSIEKDIASEELFMISFDLVKHEPRFFTKGNYNKYENHRLPLD